MSKISFRDLTEDGEMNTEEMRDTSGAAGKKKSKKAKEASSASSKSSSSSSSSSTTKKKSGSSSSKTSGSSSKKKSKKTGSSSSKTSGSSTKKKSGSSSSKTSGATSKKKKKKTGSASSKTSGSKSKKKKKTTAVTKTTGTSKGRKRRSTTASTGGSSKRRRVTARKKRVSSAAAARRKKIRQKALARRQAAAARRRKTMMGKKITAGEGAVVRKGSQFFFKRSTGVHGTGADLDVDTVIGTRSLRWDPIALDLDGNRKISTQAVKSAGKRFDWEQVGYNWSNFNKEKIDWSAVNAEWGTRADRVMKEQGQYRNLADLGLQGTASARSWDRSYSYSYKRNYYSYGRSNYNATYSREYAYDYSRQYGLSRNIQGETLGMGGAYKMKGTRSYSYKYSNDDYTGTSSYTSDSNSFAGRSDRVFSWSQASYSNSYSTSRTTIKQYGRWNLSRYESQGSYKSKGKSVSATNADVTLFSKGGKLFDLNSDSQLDRMTWVGGKDAYLAIDWNSNGRIDNGVELFGARSGDGVRELKFLDTNYDGVVNAKDKDYAKLRLMHADGSLKTLDTQKITEFSVGDRASGSGKGAKRYNRSQTDHGKNTPTAKGNDHSTDGIHDDNGRIGNNGLGPKGKKGKSGAVPSVTVGAGAEKVTGTEFYFRRKDGSKGIAVDVNLDTVMGMRRSEENAQIRRWWAANFRTTRRRIDPIALDMDGDKHISTSAVTQRAGWAGAWGGGNLVRNHEGGMAFDMNFDHLGDRTTWVSGSDAFLAIDWNKNNRIDSGAELFGPRTNDGIKELRELDSTGDGVVDKKDKKFGLLKIVQADTEMRWRVQRINGRWRWARTEVVSDTRFKTTNIANAGIVAFEVGIDPNKKKAKKAQEVADSAGRRTRSRKKDAAKRSALTSSRGSKRRRR